MVRGGRLGERIKLISGQHIEANKTNSAGLGVPYLTGPADFVLKKPIAARHTEAPKSLCETHDILITVKGSGTGSVAIADRSYCISRQLMAIRCIDIDKVFTRYLIEFNQRKFNSSAGGLIPGISRIDILNLEVPEMSSEAQTAIANILQTWDTAIETTEALIAAKEKQFGWLVKALIDQPRYQSWKSSSLADLFIFLKGSGLSKDSICVEGKFKCVLYGQLYTTYSEVMWEIFSRTNTEEGVKSKVGDVLIPASTTTSAIDLANATALMEEDVLLGGDINILRPKKEEIDSTFYAYYLTHYKRNELAKGGQGVTIIHLYSSHIKSVLVDVPPFQTQQRIAHILNTTKHEIDLLKKLADRYRTQKRGLMQKLLTGQWRVNDLERTHRARVSV